MMEEKLEKYKVVAYKESGLSSFIGAIFGTGGKVDPRKFSDFLNFNASKGYEVVTMEKNISRLLLIIKREEYLVIMRLRSVKKRPQPELQDITAK